MYTKVKSRHYRRGNEIACPIQVHEDLSIEGEVAHCHHRRLCIQHILPRLVEAGRWAAPWHRLEEEFHYLRDIPRCHVHLPISHRRREMVQAEIFKRGLWPIQVPILLLLLPLLLLLLLLLLRLPLLLLLSMLLLVLLLLFYGIAIAFAIAVVTVVAAATVVAGVTIAIVALLVAVVTLWPLLLL